MHTTGDELLDWRVAVDHYPGCRQVIVQGSDHGFREFGELLDRDAVSSWNLQPWLAYNRALLPTSLLTPYRRST